MSRIKSKGEIDKLCNSLQESFLKENILLTGGPGSGKSQTLYKVLNKILKDNELKLNIYPISPSGSQGDLIEELNKYKNSVYFPTKIARNNTEINNLLSYLSDIIDSRKKSIDNGMDKDLFTNKVLIFDEYIQEVSTGNINIDILRKLATYGVGLNIYLIIISQHINKDILPYDIEDNLTKHIDFD